MERERNRREDYGKMNVEELADMMRENRLEPEEMLIVAKELTKREQKHPTVLVPDAKESWGRFQEKYLSGTERNSGRAQIPTSGKRRYGSWLRWPVGVAAAFLLVLLTCSVTAKALGYRMRDVLVSWSKLDFYVNASSEDAADSADVFQVMELYGIPQDGVPLWLPEGYYCEKQTIGDGIRGGAGFIYSNGKNNVVLNLLMAGDSQYVKTEKEIEIYTIQGIPHYILNHREDRTTVIWTIEDCEISIDGDFSVEEAKEILNSIYKITGNE